ncbi:hypothetical protein [Moritella sp. 28]|uniref:hypothetical protein n=1 Tax=Moritella sp. 28 TaxID=2746232 RepID=UPI001BA7BCCE|nr:hypothetical protein [Moritella sp. 28]QUM84627.1 hypothetical protein HWV02_08980 [Moritella sp. 28]
MYIRFAVGTESEDPREMHGPFTEVEHLREEGLLAPYEEELVVAIFEKFNHELPCPPWTSRNWPEDAISWFKVTAQIFVSQMYNLITILKEHGIQVRVLKCQRLFKVFYEDEFQVVALDKRF